MSSRQVHNGVSEAVFTGQEQIVAEPGLVTPLPWTDWHARVRSLQVDGARADYVEYDPYRLEVPPIEDRPDGPVRMMLVVILAGTSIGTIGGHQVTLTPKQAALISGRAAMSFHAPEPIRAVRLFVDEDHLPPDRLAAFQWSFALLKDSPLVAGCVGLITGLLQVHNPTVEPHDAAAVSQPLIALQTSLLDEALHQTHDDEAATPSRRSRIDLHIEQHLHEHDLSAGTIAAALGVSLSTVHAAFAGSPHTVAADIRRRRVERAQTLLALRHEPPQVAALAARVGLSREQLTRAFQHATGQTTHQWWLEHHADI